MGYDYSLLRMPQKTGHNQGNYLITGSIQTKECHKMLRWIEKGISLGYGESPTVAIKNESCA